MHCKKKLIIFKKKFLFKINFLPDTKLVIPEYRIELLNKSKKIIDIVENLNKINAIFDSKDVSRKK